MFLVIHFIIFGSYIRGENTNVKTHNPFIVFIILSNILQLFYMTNYAILFLCNKLILLYTYNIINNYLVSLDSE